MSGATHDIYTLTERLYGRPRLASAVSFACLEPNKCRLIMNQIRQFRQPLITSTVKHLPTDCGRENAIGRLALTVVVGCTSQPSQARFLIAGGTGPTI